MEGVSAVRLDVLVAGCFHFLVSQAEPACEVSGHTVSDHFPDIGKMVNLGSDSQREVEDLRKNTSERCGEIPKGYPFYLWFKDDGYNNMGDWIETAAQKASR